MVPFLKIRLSSPMVYIAKEKSSGYVDSRNVKETEISKERVSGLLEKLKIPCFLHFIIVTFYTKMSLYSGFL